MRSVKGSSFGAEHRPEADADGTPRWACAPGEEGLKVEAAWREPQSFDRLTEVMVRFLQGRVRETPAHGGPVDPETEEILEYLIRFNIGGFMTASSQPTEVGHPDLIAFVEGFASEDLAHRLLDLAAVGTLGVVITPPRTVGGRGAYGDSFPFIDGYPSPRSILGTWGSALSFPAFAELRRHWYVVAFDSNDRDPGRLWRNILEEVEGPPAGSARLFEHSVLDLRHGLRATNIERRRSRLQA